VTSSLLKNFHGSKLQAVTLTNGYFPQNETGTPTNERLHKLLYYENLMSRLFKKTGEYVQKSTLRISISALSFYQCRQLNLLLIAFYLPCRSVSSFVSSFPPNQFKNPVASAQKI
jgi:hypothetical protein